MPVFFSKIRFIIFVGELIGSEYFANKLALRNKPLAEKMFSKIKDLLTGKGDKIDKQTRKYLNKVYKSFAKALDKSVGGISLSMFDGDDDKKAAKDINENIDSDAEMRYNSKGVYKQIPKKEYATISSRIMEDNSRYMARNQELPRYGKARSADYFYVYENFAPSNFGVLKQIKITDANREYIASIEAKIGENNGEQTIRSTSELNRVLEVLKTRTRRNRRSNALDSEGRANSDNGGISLGESESDGIGHSQKGNGNSEVRYENNLRLKANLL